MGRSIFFALHLLWLVMLPIIAITLINMIFGTSIEVTLKCYLATAFLLFIIHDLTKHK